MAAFHYQYYEQVYSYLNEIYILIFLLHQIGIFYLEKNEVLFAIKFSIIKVKHYSCWLRDYE